MQRRYLSDVSPHLQSQLIACVSAIHLGAGQAEPPFKAGWAFGQSVADWTEDVLIHRDGFCTWRECRKKKSQYWDNNCREKSFLLLIDSSAQLYWVDFHFRGHCESILLKWKVEN